MMRFIQSKIPRHTAIYLGLPLTLASCIVTRPPSLTYVTAKQRQSDYDSNAHELYETADYGLFTSIYYVGSDPKFDYFKIAACRGYNRLEINLTQLPSRFEVGTGKPYRAYILARGQKQD